MKFKTRRPRKIDVPTYAPPRQSQGDDVPPPGTRIQGITPMSKEEWYVSQWLDGKGLRYKYQYYVNAGGPEYFYKLDFLVYTLPLYTMVEPLGNHWHTDVLGQDDRKRQIEIENALRSIARTPIQFINVEDMINRETVEARLQEIFHAY